MALADSPLNSQGFNLFFNPSDCAIVGDTATNITGLQPNLGPLLDNGGPTRTHALVPDSPALDAGNPATPGGADTACSHIDQRGVLRPQDGNDDGILRCDIGAFELEDFVFLGFPTLDPSDATVEVHEPLIYTLTWTVPAALQTWHILETLQLRIRDDRDTVLWLFFDERTNTFSLFNEARGEVGSSFPPMQPKPVPSRFVTTHHACLCPQLEFLLLKGAVRFGRLR